MDVDKDLKKVLWVSWWRLDMDISKTSQIEVLKHLARRGYDVHLIATHSKSHYRLRTPEVNIVSIPLRYVPIVSVIIYDIMLFFTLPVYIAILRPDFIVTDPEGPIWGFLSTLPFSRLRRFRILLDVRSTPVETVGLRGYLLRVFFFNISIYVAKRFFDCITIITSLMKEEICKSFTVDPNFVKVWTTGVSITLFRSEKHVYARNELRKKFGLLNKFVIFYHGAFTPSRGLQETIAAVSMVKHAHPDVVLFLLGSGSAIYDLERLIWKNKLQDNVIIHGVVDYEEVPKYIAMCDVGIVPLPDLPYWRHQCPLKLLEYLAMKKVVIVTDIPANRSVIGKEKCGIYVSPVTPTEIAKSIIYAYNNRENLKEWGASGRRIVNEKYTWEKVAKNLESYLLSIRK
jgi:glycosyltransferase involved in cell wall biosynthesis